MLKEFNQAYADNKGELSIKTVYKKEPCLSLVLDWAPLTTDGDHPKSFGQRIRIFTDAWGRYETKTWHKIPPVVLTRKGNEPPTEIVVLGGDTRYFPGDEYEAERNVLNRPASSSHPHQYEKFTKMFEESERHVIARIPLDEQNLEKKLEDALFAASTQNPDIFKWTIFGHSKTLAHSDGRR